MSFLLDIAYLLLAIVASPLILLKLAASARWRAGLRQRLGAVPPRNAPCPCIWVHAVSVGEVNAALPFIELLIREYPRCDIRVSTTTNTGQHLAQKLLGPERCFYYPLDLSAVVRRAFRRIQPDLIVLVELELWPNFLRVAHQRRVPILVINGRMREKQVPRYRLARPFFASAFGPDSLNLFCVQNAVYADRFERAGIPRERILVTGNIKYDALHAHAAPEPCQAVRDALGLVAGEPLWVAASTWPGEEAICLRVHRRLLEEDPALRLVIAPRHVERAPEVERAIERAGFSCRKRSAKCGPSHATTVCLLDTIGELRYVYAFADFAFIGKTLAVGGGHNMLEAAALGATPVFGPMTGNFENEAELLLDHDAAERVADEAGLGEALVRLLRDPALRRGRTERGREILRQQGGASRRNLEVVQRLLARPHPPGTPEHRHE